MAKEECMVTVVVPVYNSEDTISACIESILAQTHKVLQVVVVDDGSTDGSGGICEQIASADSRVLVIHQQNQGRTAARHAGVTAATGEWLAFVDGDDTLPADAIRILFEHAGPDTDIVLGNANSLPGEQRSIIPLSDFRHFAVRAEGTIGVPWGSLYRRQLLTPYLFDLPRSIMMGEDYIFWLRLVFSTKKDVNAVYENVYCKGQDHTSGTFVWTAEYAQQLQDYRLQTIPSADHALYEYDMLCDRIDNLFAVAVWSNRKQWHGSKFYSDILADTKRLSRPLSPLQRLLLWLPSLRLRRTYAIISTFFHRVKK
jgi:glycosyltransferase involved in cell wall biosynthesis